MATPGPERLALTEAFHKAMTRHRLVAGVFLTYRLDPGFFEQEVLPVFFDRPFSQVPKTRLAQLEAVLQERPGSVAVYYDTNGLKGGEEPARLDIGRFPVRLERGIFHPKNVFALVEADEPDEEGTRRRKLLVGCLSANLTEAGWWRNLEAAHVEKIEEGDKSCLADEIRPFLAWLRAQPVTDAPQWALEEIRSFLDKRSSRVDSTTWRHRDGTLQPRFYWGRSEGGEAESVVQFLKRTAGRELKGLRMEVLSPYFDEAEECEPLAELVRAFDPAETRVFLPRDGDGKGCVDQRIYKAVGDLGAGWGRLPKELLKMGRAEDAALRSVHAKVIRFFSKSPKREIWFVGSANLTSPAFSGKANRETGFLVEIERDKLPPGPPEFWMALDGQKPKEFEPGGDPEEPAASGGTRLAVVQDWDAGSTRVYWDHPKASPLLVVSSNGVEVFRTEGLPPRTWTTLPAEDSAKLAGWLVSTSVFEVREGSEDEIPGLLLVQEVGMFRKPSLAPERTAADILKDWAAPSEDRRVALLEEALASGLPPHELDDRPEARDTAPVLTLFDRFAGIFHGFSSLEKRVVEQLGSKNDEGAAYLLFGKTYTSLEAFLDRETQEEREVDPVNLYVSFLCARQLISGIRKEAAAAGGTFLDRHAESLRRLEQSIAEVLDAERARLTGEIGPEGAAFLDWFDRWFLRRATPAGEAG